MARPVESTKTEYDRRIDLDAAERAPRPAPTYGAPAASGLNVLVGLWLLISPWVLGYDAFDGGLWNAAIIGAAVAILALVRTAAPLQFESLSWVNFVLGGWLVISGWVLQPSADVGFNESAMTWNFVISGLLIVALAAWSAMATQKSPAGGFGTRDSDAGRV